MSAKSLDRSRIGLDYRHLGAISDRVVLSKLYNGKIPTESWLPPQYDGETKRHRDMGSMGTPSKNVAFVGTKARIKYNKRRIQPNNKATRKTLTLTIYMKKRPDWNKLESFFKVSATLKIAIFPYLRFQRFQIDMLENFLLKKKSEKNIISVERYRG